METKTVKLYSLDYNNVKTYLAASLFILGNLALPQLFHLIPQGGITWLPIYFFTLVGAYKFGWKVGLLTAVLSPVLNSLLFGMPLPAALRHSVEVCITGCGGGLGSTPFPAHFPAYSAGSSSFLSGSRYFGRMGHGGQLLPGCTRFPYRCAGNGIASGRRIFTAEI